MLNSKMKKLVTSMIALILCLSSVSAMACTAIYVGSDLTADGTTMFARSEDISNSYNKSEIFYTSELCFYLLHCSSGSIVKIKRHTA